MQGHGCFVFNVTMIFLVNLEDGNICKQWKFQLRLSENFTYLPFVKEELDSSFNTSLSHSSGNGNGHYLVYYAYYPYVRLPLRVSRGAISLFKHPRVLAVNRHPRRPRGR